MADPPTAAHIEEKSELLLRAEDLDGSWSTPGSPRSPADGAGAWSSRWQGHRRGVAVSASVLAAALLGCAALLMPGHDTAMAQNFKVDEVSEFAQKKAHHKRHDQDNRTLQNQEAPAQLPEPMYPLSNMAGVNFGGWLCLEDWFFSGAAGEFVDSGWPFTGQGACLPSLLPDVGDQPWQSEGTLTKSLGEDAVDVLADFREKFITEGDWQQAAALGIKCVRVPITWAAFADALADAAPDVYGQHDPDKDTVIVPDPYYVEELAFATIPRNFMRQILDRARKYNLNVVWDIHAFIGGSSNGTYSGVWPSAPMFWTGSLNVGDTDMSLTDAGLLIAKALIKWVEEGLSDEQRDTIQGLSLMNEPAHLSGGSGWADQDQMLDWIKQASDAFRWSTLPGQGIKLYVNVVETAFRNMNDGFEEMFPSWWTEHFSIEERTSWAVFDRHKYWTWEPDCNGCDEWEEDGTPKCAWQCDTDRGQVEEILSGCIGRWKDRYTSMFPDGMIAVSEFSTGTFRHANTACRDMDLARTYFQMQADAFQEAGIEPFFWTWKMPYGPIFQSGWSLKSIAGVGDDQQYECGPAAEDDGDGDEVQWQQ